VVGGGRPATGRAGARSAEGGPGVGDRQPDRHVHHRRYPQRNPPARQGVPAARVRLAAGAPTRYPVIEALTGFPGTPNSWLAGLDAQNVLDRELAAGRIAPTVVVFPFQTYQASRDSECVDAVG